jgi:D-alanyl-D-alanine-carboxypeptidase/D-alanyl-D-alanine-endopeptidase
MKRALLIGVALALCLGTAACCQTKAQKAGAAARDRTMAQLTRIVHDRVDSGRAPSIVAGMIFPDGSTRIVAYGMAGNGKRVDENSIFEIGSVTKTFTATLLSDMAQRGEVRLTEPVAELLPAGVSVPSRNGRQITLLDLATHSSGLPREATNLPSKDINRPYAGYTAAELYAFLRTYRLARDPGATSEYSNVGEGLLGQALALRSGKTYEELVRERILDPLHMTSSGINLPGDLRPHLVRGHDADGALVPPFDMGVLAGAGSLRSTVVDMLKFAAANLDSGNGELQRAIAVTHIPRRRFGQEQIGLNWINQQGILWHNGGTIGCSSFIGIDPKQHVAIVVLSNSRMESVDDIGFHMLDRRMRLAPAPATVPRETLRRYVGVYRAANQVAQITLTMRGLSLRLGTSTARLYPESKTAFEARRLTALIIFRLDTKQRVVGLDFHDPSGKTYVAKKIR